MPLLFHRHRSRFSRPARTRRARPATVGITPERLEQRIALDVAAGRTLLEQARTLVMDQSMGPSPVVMTMQQVAGTDARSFVISHVPEGSVVEKWDTATSTWLEVSTEPASANPRELMRRLANRVIHQGDRLQWRPQAGGDGVTQHAFQMINWDDGSELLGASAQAPSAVENLAATPTGIGELTLTWNPPASGNATTYTVTVAAASDDSVSDGDFIASTIDAITSITSATSCVFPGLENGLSYGFTVSASNEAGTGVSTTTTFGPAVFVGDTNTYDLSLSGINVPWGPSLVAMAVPWATLSLENYLEPFALTTGLDGSIWATFHETAAEAGFAQQTTNASGVWSGQSPIEVGRNFPTAITTGLDGSIWVASGLKDDGVENHIVQQITNSAGTWTAQPPIAVGSQPLALTTGLDGSIWVANTGSETVQQITNSGGVWTAQPPIELGAPPQALTTGRDGSIWVSLFNKITAGDAAGSVRHITNTAGVWTAQPAIEVGVQPFELTTGLDGSIWVMNMGLGSNEPSSSYNAADGTSGKGSVQQITASEGVWTAQPPVITWEGGSAGSGGLATGLAGEIWVTNAGGSGEVQKISKNSFGVWAAEVVPGGASMHGDITVGLDGSLWAVMVVGEQGASRAVLHRWIAPPQAPTDLAAVFGPGPGQLTLGWQPAEIDGGSAAFAYTATVAQGEHFQTITTSNTSSVFEGLTLGNGPTYFTVTATNLAGISTVARYQIDAAGNAIPLNADTAVGISTDGTGTTGGGFDGLGNTYSWEALGNASSGGSRIGSALISGGLSIDLGSPNQPDFTWAEGQTLEVAGTGTVLTLAAAAVAPWQTDQQLVLNFTDGSTATWTQSFSDWCDPQSYPNESILSSQDSLNTVSGGQDATDNFIYSYGYTLPEGKTLKSITLPDNPHLRLLGVALSTPAAVELSWNAYGLVVGNNQVPNSQGMDGHGNYYNVNDAGNGLGQATSGPDESNYDYRQIAWGGAIFDLGPAPNHYSQSNNRHGNNNFVQASGQTISVPSGDFSSLLLIGAGVNGNQSNQAITLHFSDGSTATWTQTFTDWRNNTASSNPPPSAATLAATGETLVAGTNVVAQTGNNRMYEHAYVYGYHYDLPEGKTLVSVTLPSNHNIGILGMALV